MALVGGGKTKAIGIINFVDRPILEYGFIPEFDLVVRGIV